MATTEAVAMNVTSEYASPAPSASASSGIPGDLLAAMIVLAIFSLLGIVGNALAFYIYYQKRDKSTSTLFILALAVVDFVACLVVIPFTIVAEGLEYTIYSEILCKSYLFLITCNTPLSALLLVAIGVDRYFCICHPFLHVITQRRAKIIILSLTLFAFALGVLTSLTYGIHREKDFDIIGDDASNVSAAVTQDVGNVTAWLENVTMTMRSSMLVNGTTASPVEAEDLYNGTEAAAHPTLGKDQGDRPGQCVPVYTILGQPTVKALQKFHVALFLISLVILAIMYVLIYRSILVRRAWRMKRKRMSCYTSVNGNETQIEETTLTGVNNGNGAHHHGHGHIDKTKVNRKNSAKLAAAIREKNLYANVKTAAMLFVVSVVFIVCFLPAWLMNLHVVELNVIVFNLYFFNNVANPFIYAFMNRAFRDDLKQLVQNCPQKPEK